MNDIKNREKWVKQTLEHKREVYRKGFVFVKILEQRLAEHDNSKLMEPEMSLFLPTLDFKDHPFGSDEYKEQTKLIIPAIREHHKNNRHHPKYNPNGIDGFDLIDLLEYYLDTCEACQSRGNGKVDESLKVLKDRDGMSEQTFNILMNTWQNYGGFEGKGEVEE